MTADDPYAVLSALIDREAVDPETLARALEDAEGRRTLVDFVRLRTELMRDDEHQGERTDAAKQLAFRAPRAGQWRLAAVILLPLVLGAAGGYWLRDQPHAERPPTPSRVITFVRGVDWK